jgi:hypothetical protein
LRAGGIPFRVAQRKRQFFWRVDEHYEIWVPAEFYDNAKIIAEERCFDFDDSLEDQAIMELPDAGLGVTKRDSEDWRSSPEDATVEVWSEKTEEDPGSERVKGLAWMIELSLRENGIGTHSRVSEHGFRKLFVKPKDELQAREIVREIENGTPPE